MEIKGDLKVRRTGIFDRRADQALKTDTLTADYDVIRHDYHWLRFDGGVADRAVTLPDATTLSTGWKIVVENFGTTNMLNVKNNAAATLKSLTYAPLGSTEGAAYEFTLLENSTAAGIWYVTEFGDPTSGGMLAQKSVANFLVADWSAVVSDYSELTKVEIAGLGADQGTGGHGRGTLPIYIVQEKIGTTYDRTICDRERMAASGDLALRVTDGSQFDGRVILV